MCNYFAFKQSIQVVATNPTSKRQKKVPFSDPPSRQAHRKLDGSPNMDIYFTLLYILQSIGRRNPLGEGVESLPAQLFISHPFSLSWIHVLPNDALPPQFGLFRACRAQALITYCGTAAPPCDSDPTTRPPPPSPLILIHIHQLQLQLQLQLNHGPYSCSPYCSYPRSGPSPDSPVHSSA